MSARGLACAMLLTLSACGTLGPERGRAPRTFLLEPELAATAVRGEAAPLVQVAAPQVRAGYDVADMVYTRRPFELEYYAHHAWASPPGAMLQPLLVRALESAGVMAVVTPIGGEPSRWRLDTEFLELAHDHENGGGSAGVVSLWAQLTRMDRSGTVFTRRFAARHPARAAEPYAGAEAVNAALGQVLDELAAFVRDTAALASMTEP